MGQDLVEISTSEGVIDAQLFTPQADGPWPAVIMLTDIRGARPTFEGMAKRLAAMGFSVLLPNLYHRAGRAPFHLPPGPNTDPAVRERLDQLKGTVTREGARRDIAALLTFLDDRRETAGKVGIVGYCMSGSIALRSAADFSDRIGAAASFHGGGLANESADSPHLLVSAIQAPLYLGYASNDKSMSVEAIQRLELALTGAQVAFEAETYPAAHGFAVPDSPAFDKDAAEQHWDRLARLFKSALSN